MKESPAHIAGLFYIGYNKIIGTTRYFPYIARTALLKQKEFCFMAWLYLLFAGLLEIGWVIGLKYAEGFSKLIPSALTITAIIASMVFLSLAVRTLPLGTSYAIWTGIGTVGAMIAGIILFGESATAMRIGCALLIVSGIIGLKMTAH